MKVTLIVLLLVGVAVAHYHGGRRGGRGGRYVRRPGGLSTFGRPSRLGRRPGGGLLGDIAGAILGGRPGGIRPPFTITLSGPNTGDDGTNTGTPGVDGPVIVPDDDLFLDNNELTGNVIDGAINELQDGAVIVRQAPEEGPQDVRLRILLALKEFTETNREKQRGDVVAEEAEMIREELNKNVEEIIRYNSLRELYCNEADQSEGGNVEPETELIEEPQEIPEEDEVFTRQMDDSNTNGRDARFCFDDINRYLVKNPWREMIRNSDSECAGDLDQLNSATEEFLAGTADRNEAIAEAYDDEADQEEIAAKLNEGNNQAQKGLEQLQTLVSAKLFQGQAPQIN